MLNVLSTAVGEGVGAVGVILRDFGTSPGVLNVISTVVGEGVGAFGIILSDFGMCITTSAGDNM